MDTTNQTSGGDLRLGTLLGRRQAFSTIAARCSAADAGALREIRDQKVYQSLEPTFAEFCSRRIGISATHANRIIRYLNEFGPEYFELAHLTGISLSEYRAIAPAVAELCAAVPKRPEPSRERQFDQLERKSVRLAEEFRNLSQTLNGTPERVRYASILGAARGALERLELVFGRLI